MILYSGTTCPFSHRCRFLLYEKGMDFEVRDVDVNNIPADILTMNPYGDVPVLVEREFFSMKLTSFANIWMNVFRIRN